MAIEGNVRYFRASDAKQMPDVFRRSVTGLGSPFYSDKQVRAWAAHAPSAENFLRFAAIGGLIFVYSDPDDNILAYAMLETNGPTLVTYTV